MPDNGFTPQQVAQLRGIVRDAIREELSDAGLRLDGSDHQDAAREDFRFVRNFRLSYEGAVNKIGNSVLIAVLVILGTIMSLGFWQWIKH